MPRAERGQALLEFAIALPVVILVMVMIAEFGWFVAQSSAVIHASREGGRYASAVESVSGTPRYLNCSGIRDAARKSAVVTALPDSRIIIQYLRSGSAYGSCTTSGPAENTVCRFDQVQVTVRYPYQAMTPLGSMFLGNRNLESVDRRTITKDPTGTTGC
jgi:Flp pilus assembly protein TadG